MAPKKRRSRDVEEEAAGTTSLRVTRSSTRRLNGYSLADSVTQPPELPKTERKKAKTASAKDDEEGVVDKGSTIEEGKVSHEGAKTKTIVIEHCKQCNSFKTRAILVKDGLEKGVSGITVLVNPEKPRRGCFEVREEGGQKFISLLDMKRPFKPMKELDMDKVISDIVNKIK
ncbi:hypothetical protein NMG60_11001304 [Bertholletia excelsa]